MISAILSTFTRRPIFGYLGMVLALVATGVNGLGLWVHHMLATGLPPLGMSFFTAASVIALSVLVFAYNRAQSAARRSLARGDVGMGHELAAPSYNFLYIPTVNSTYPLWESSAEHTVVAGMPKGVRAVLIMRLQRCATRPDRAVSLTHDLAAAYSDRHHGHAGRIDFHAVGSRLGIDSSGDRADCMVRAEAWRSRERRSRWSASHDNAQR